MTLTVQQYVLHVWTNKWWTYPDGKAQIYTLSLQYNQIYDTTDLHIHRIIWIQMLADMLLLKLSSLNSQMKFSQFNQVLPVCTSSFRWLMRKYGFFQVPLLFMRSQWPRKILFSSNMFSCKHCSVMLAMLNVVLNGKNDKQLLKNKELAGQASILFYLVLSKTAHTLIFKTFLCMFLLFIIMHISRRIRNAFQSSIFHKWLYK